MKEDKIRAIIEKKLDKLSALSENLGIDFDKETIHDLRTDFKSTRSYLRLLRVYTQNTSLKFSKKFKRLYHIAGAIRDAQLKLENAALQLLEIPGYFEHLNSIILQQKKEWDLHYSKKILHRLNARFSVTGIGPLPAVALVGFIETRISTIDSLSWPQSITDNQLHSIRKLMKDIIYTAKIADKKWKSAAKKIRSFDIETLDSIADRIGNYNDERIIREHLLSFSSGLNPADKKRIRAFCSKKAIELKSAKLDIITQVRKFIDSGWRT